MTGTTISLGSSKKRQFTGYLAVPSAKKGPGLILFQEIFGVNGHIRKVADLFAEEGYVVLAPDVFWRAKPDVRLGYSDKDIAAGLALRDAVSQPDMIKDIGDAIKALKARREVDGKIGALGFCMGGRLAYLAAAHYPKEIAVAISYYGTSIEQNLKVAKKIKQPVLFHFAEKDGHVPPRAVGQIRKAMAHNPQAEVHLYPDADHGFYCDERPSFNKPAAMMSHSRTIGALRRALGPKYDLSSLWDRHVAYEFADRDTDKNMTTMVAQPYVNHIPTLTGGYGFDELHRFYKYHFIPKTPKDTNLIPISRTVGADRVVDEMLFCFTHDEEIDWMLPGVPPTGKRVEVPLVAIICFRGDKLYFEHIHWDQATVLVQIGLLDPKGLPVAGVETARKFVQPDSVPSNRLMSRWKMSEEAATKDRLARGKKGSATASR